MVEPDVVVKNHSVKLDHPESFSVRGWKTFMDNDSETILVGVYVATQMLIDEFHEPKMHFHSFMDLSDTNYKFLEQKKYTFEVYGYIFFQN